jgi:ATP synthase protein I
VNRTDKPQGQPVDSHLRSDGETDRVEDLDFKPLSAEQARVWRAAQVSVSIWRVNAWQWMAVLVAGLLACVASGSAAVGWSAGYGGAAVALPTAVMAYGVQGSRLGRVLALFRRGALAGVFFWEGVKVLLAVVLMALAPTIVPDLNWLALVAGLVVVLKVYWLAFFWLGRTPSKN